MMIDRKQAETIAHNNRPYVKAILCVESRIEDAANNGDTVTWFGPVEKKGLQDVVSDVKEELIRRGFSVTSEIKTVSFRGIGKTGEVLTIKWGINE